MPLGSANDLTTLASFPSLVTSSCMALSLSSVASRLRDFGDVLVVLVLVRAVCVVGW
jgi:hypothetical protein